MDQMGMKIIVIMPQIGRYASYIFESKLQLGCCFKCYKKIKDCKHGTNAAQLMLYFFFSFV